MLAALQDAPAMFEEEEQQQTVPPLKAALEDAVAAAEAEGRMRQPGVNPNPVQSKFWVSQKICKK